VKGAWGTVIGAGALLAGHHLAFYEAVNHIPLGAVATIEFLGPFVIALAGSPRAVDLLPACLAVGGVLLLSGGGVPLAPAGLAPAAVAACCWAGYILVSSRMARRISGGQGRAAVLVHPEGAAPDSAPCVRRADQHGAGGRRLVRVSPARAAAYLAAVARHRRRRVRLRHGDVPRSRGAAKLTRERGGKAIAHYALFPGGEHTCRSVGRVTP
jgi:hypothetical protein